MGGKPMTTAERTAIKFKIPITLEPDGNGFCAYSPHLKGLVMGGGTKEEALKNVTDAARGYLQTMIKYGDPIPIAFNERVVDEEETLQAEHHVISVTIP
ncbi:MAG: type II toxin-antitoxin system HicB family antitoxin [Calditrichota bacterium]